MFYVEKMEHHQLFEISLGVLLNKIRFMALFLSRLVKPALVRRSSSVSLLLSNGFSTSLRQTPPCAIIGATYCGNDIGRLIVSYANEPRSCNQLEKRVPVELVYPQLFNDGKTQTIGASYGWIATLNKDDGILRLQDDLNLLASDTDPKRIQLPPLVTMPHCQTKIITNVSMSSSSPEDFIVAVKFSGPQLSFCRPADSKNEWVNIRIDNPCFHSSRVMFSKKDDVFHLLGSGGLEIASVGFCTKSVVVRWYKKTKSGIAKMKTKALKLFKLDEEEGNGDELLLSAADLNFLDSCCKSEHLVESPTGDTFLVEQYKKKIVEEEGVARLKTVVLMVYKVDDEGNTVYIQDMGDLTMFLSNSEPFCVPSSSFPGLRRNYIHLLDVDEVVGADVAHIPFSMISVGGSFSTPYYFPPQDIHN
ncbi:unnamed protein product [Eruca vesicaria subsp. sativa]|uniref:KIB1-4 beta-propeller domain-containing protein n=1 Tax=Eruca vesicaria subsp. sativa TaxID=29727 RepID=A0ABC8LKN8_ERUVS|nr:unnamed protein product [Eruca vesicaria subsp. sativa]